MPDYDNWDNEREGIINDTLDAVGDIRDDQAEALFSGSFQVNPQVMVKGQCMIVGPIVFEQAFETKPTIVFGQTPTGITSPAGQSSSNVPFLVQPYTANLNFSNGKVDGFWLGLYALTDVPSGVVLHTIDWEAKGKGSPYHQQELQESWTEQYDHNEAEYLVEEAINDEDF